MIVSDGREAAHTSSVTELPDRFCRAFDVKLQIRRFMSTIRFQFWWGLRRRPASRRQAGRLTCANEEPAPQSLWEARLDHSARCGSSCPLPNSTLSVSRVRRMSDPPEPDAAPLLYMSPLRPIRRTAGFAAEKCFLLRRCCTPRQRRDPILRIGCRERRREPGKERPQCRNRSWTCE